MTADLGSAMVSSQSDKANKLFTHQNAFTRAEGVRQRKSVLTFNTKIRKGILQKEERKLTWSSSNSKQHSVERDASLSLGVCGVWEINSKVLDLI